MTTTTARLLALLAALLWGTVASADLDDIRRNAEAGDVEAQLELGILFQYGFNYKDNEIPALTWYSLAANQGHPRAVQLRDSLRAKMSEQEVSEALEQVAQFKPTGKPVAPPTPPPAMDKPAEAPPAAPPSEPVTEAPAPAAAPTGQ